MTVAESYDYQQRAVAFIDVLGFADLVNRSESDPEMRAKVGSLIATNALFEKFVKQFLSPSADAAVFSDSFVLSMSADQIIHMVREVGYLCRRLLLLGLPCRGAITSGSLYHRGQIVVGPALIKAYQLERDVAVYPRVLLDDASMATWRNEFNPPSEHQNINSLVKKDRDGQHFIDIFHPAWPDFFPWTDFVSSTDLVPVGQVEFLQATSGVIEAGLDKSKYNAKVHAKYSWLRSQCVEQSAVL
jgi:hypothetical protein